MNRESKRELCSLSNVSQIDKLEAHYFKKPEPFPVGEHFAGGRREGSKPVYVSERSSVLRFKRKTIFFLKLSTVLF